MPLLSIEDLSVSYEHEGQSVLAVDQVSLSIEPQEIVALVGESGSGKSSLGLAITRLLPNPPVRIHAHTLEFNGLNILEASESQLRRLRGKEITYVFQDPASSLNPVLTLGDQLREVIEYHTDRRGKAADAHALEWLQHVGIPNARLSAYPHEFSGGMQQRLMIAMAMASQPKLLIADEPTSALDVTVQVQILRLLRQLQQQYRLSILLISHDLLVVRRMAHRVVVLRKGQIVESGSVPQILEHPTHPYTQSLLAARASMSIPAQ